MAHKSTKTFSAIEYTKLSDIVAAHIANKGVTQVQLASSIGILPSYLSWMKNPEYISKCPDYVLKMAFNYFGINKEKELEGNAQKYKDYKQRTIPGDKEAYKLPEEEFDLFKLLSAALDPDLSQKEIKIGMVANAGKYAMRCRESLKLIYRSVPDDVTPDIDKAYLYFNSLPLILERNCLPGVDDLLDEFLDKLLKLLEENEKLFKKFIKDELY